MNLFKRLFERRDANPNDVWAVWRDLRSGVTVDSAQSIAAVYASVSVISEAVGSLPLKLYARGDTRTEATDHPLDTVLHRHPNDAQSPQEFWEWMVAAMLLHGNAYARIEHGHDGQVRSLWPLPAERVVIVRAGDRIAGYRYTTRDGDAIPLLPEDVFHLRHRAGADPLIGVSPIQAAKGVIELAQAEQEHGLANFSNGTKLSGVLKVPGVLKADQREALKAAWQGQYAGAANAGKTPVLEGGTEFQQVSMSLEDAQWIAARRFSVEEVARVFKVPPALIGDMGNTNYSNSVQMNRWFVTHCLQRHMSAIEGGINRQLLSAAGRQSYYAEFSAEGLLRGDSATRAKFYESGIAAGWMLPSEARRLENLPAVAGIDERPNHARLQGDPANYPSKE